MLQGCTAWPEDYARRYRQQGYWSDITLNEMLRRSAAVAPERIALVYGERRMSYAQLVGAVDNLAGQFIALGFKPLDRVVFQLPNSIDFVIAFFALLRGVFEDRQRGEPRAVHGHPGPRGHSRGRRGRR